MSPDYKTNDPKGWCGDPKRGAALGRPSIHNEDKNAALALKMRRVLLDVGGYDENGTYFGIGEPLYWYAADDGSVDSVLRAKNATVAEARVRERYPNATVAWDTEALDDFTTAYIECALWSTMDNADDSGGEPLDANYGIEDIAPDTLAQMKKDCEDFREANIGTLRAAGLHDEQAGHDFWLTREGHGAGFWDRGLGELGEKLTEASKAYGSFDLVVCDDGKIHH